MAEKIKEVLQKPALRDFFQGATVSVEIMNGCRDWMAWFRNLGPVLEGGLLLDQTANHAFIFVSRKDPWPLLIVTVVSLLC